jgi:hypothetical protein
VTGEGLQRVSILQPAIDLFEHCVDSHQRVRVLRLEAVQHTLVASGGDQTNEQKGIGIGSPFQVVSVNPLFSEAASSFPPVDQLWRSSSR